MEDFINSIKCEEWLRTQCGVMYPDECVLYDKSWEAPSAISQIPFLDRDYCGEDILEYKTELNLLGVMVDFQENYQIVIDNLKPPAILSYLMAEPLIFALKCMQNSSSTGKLVDSLRSTLLHDYHCMISNDSLVYSMDNMQIPKEETFDPIMSLMKFK